MDYRTLAITIQYAEDLNKVTFISKMGAYVVVSISGGDEICSKQKTKTTVNYDDGANPTWRFPMKFTVEEAALLQNRLVLDFKIKCARALGDRVIGEVHVPVKELLHSRATGRGGATESFVTYQVQKPSGKPKGKLTFSYKFRGNSTTSAAAAVEGVHGQPPIMYPVVEPITPEIYPPIPQQSAAAAKEYPVVELEASPAYLMTAPGVYPPIPPEEKVCWGTLMPASACTLLEPTPPYTPAASGLYPPIPPPAGYIPAGGLKLERYPPPPPPVMQLAPDWWIVDWRYDTRCSGF